MKTIRLWINKVFFYGHLQHILPQSMICKFIYFWSLHHLTTSICLVLLLSSSAGTELYMQRARVQLPRKTSHDKRAQRQEFKNKLKYHG